MMMKFNRVRIREGKIRPTGTVPCVRWQIDDQRLVKISHKPAVAGSGKRLGVILDLDWPLANHPVKNRKESLC